MSIITLTTDYGLKDHFVGAIKGKILSEFETATIVDISHDIDAFNTTEASYIISSAYSSFPKGTVHIIGVDIEQEGVINYPVKKLFLCAGFSDAEYATTTEVYPDSPKVTDAICIEAQVAAITGGLNYLRLR